MTLGVNDVRRFAAVNTKIRALKGRMLNNQDYIKLLSKQSVKDIANYLRLNTAYRKVLDTKNIEEIHRGELELILKKYIVLQYEKILHYFTDEYRKLFRILFMRYEIEDLKLYLRALTRGENPKELDELVLYSGIYSTVNHKLLSNTKDIGGFVRSLKGTIYYDILRPYENEDKHKLTFYMEMVLDRNYFRNLYEQVLKLKKHDQEILKELLGKNIDLLNLEWIYRGLKFYKLSPEELINYTLVGGYNLTYEDIKNLCYSKDENQLMVRMIDSKYGFLFDNKDTLDLFMERRIERYLYFQFLSYYKKGRIDITQSIAYIHLLEYEMRDIISITEAIRYGLDNEEAKRYLIRRIEGRDS